VFAHTVLDISFDSEDELHGDEYTEHDDRGVDEEL
jgi:hypothetical protein